MLDYAFSIGLANKYKISKAYFAANNDKLISIYKKFGKIYDPIPKTINFAGIERSGYLMLSCELGKNRSLKRSIYRLMIKIASLKNSN